MKITNIRTVCLRVPYEEDKKIQSSLGVWNHRNGMFLLVDTDEGITGIGEIWSNFPQWSHFEKEASVHEGLAPLIIGADPLDIPGILATAGHTLQRIGSQWGAVGIANQILSGLDIALWDIAGKVANKPICSLLGQDPGPVQIYCSGLGPNHVVEDAKAHMAMGVTHFKLKIGMNPEKDLENLAALRATIGPDRMMMVDANQGWDIDTALKMAPILESFNLYWVEEPLMADDVEGLERLRSETNLRIAGGENLYGKAFERHLQKGLLHVCQPDITKCGGITRMMEIANMCKEYGVEVAPHFYGNGVGYAASIHLMDAMGSKVMEHDSQPNPMRTDCVVGCPETVENGKVLVSSGAGLGLTLNEDEIAKYLFKPF